jgi:hypothetical protein
MTSGKFREILNVRLDEQLAREIARIAALEGRSESEVARSLLGYGIEVVRRLRAQEYGRPFSWQEEDLDSAPGLVEIEAKWRPMTDDELLARGLSEFVFDGPEDSYEG